jgi:hypothetical protein
MLRVAPVRSIVFWSAGAAILLYSLCLLALSGFEGLPAWPSRGALLTYVAASVAAGLAFLILFLVCHGIERGRITWMAILGLGLAMRLVLIPSAPFREDDQYRYFFDAAMIAQGQNPYIHAPEKVLADDRARARIARTAEEEAKARAINHPHLATIYPPVAQGAFLAAYAIKPWSAFALRLVYLLADLAGFALLLWVLRRQGRPFGFLALYWWNPLTLAQAYNHGHMELLLYPALIALAAALSLGRTHLAAAAIGVAAAIKLWPALLFAPVAARDGWNSPRTAAAAAIAALVAAPLLWPLLERARSPDSGLAAYAGAWLWNEPLLTALRDAAVAMGGALGMADADANALFRLSLALAASAAAIGVAAWFRRSADPVAPLLWLALAVFLLAPAKFPWYALWMAPFLPLVPRLAPALLIVTMPLYYLRFVMEPAGMAGYYDMGIAWLQYAPVWLTLAWPWLAARGLERPHVRR